MDAYNFIIVFVLILCSVYGKHEIYDGHSLFEVTITDAAQKEFLQQAENLLSLDVWTLPTPSKPGQVLVPKDRRVNFEKQLSAAGIKYEVLVENIKEILEQEDQMLADAAQNLTTISKVELGFHKILTFSEVEEHLKEIAEKYPNLVTLHSAGKTVEKRDIWYLKISTTNFEDKSKPVVFIQSLLHAREWITLPVTLYAIQQLVVEVSEKELLQDVDWIVMPVANPDGYVYTHDEERFWRKNRAKNYGPFCSGVDLNRNFHSNWGQASSNFVCMDTFHGRNPFSEPETVAIRDIMLAHLGRLELFIDVHSYGSMILYSYGNGLLPPNASILNMLAVKQAKAIDSVKADYNGNYVVGNVASVLYEASGNSIDYATSIGIPLAYTYELPPIRFGFGAFGFLVDPVFIGQAGLETWEGIKVGAGFVRNKYRVESESLNPVN